MGRADALKERRLTHGLPTSAGCEVVAIFKNFLCQTNISEGAEFWGVTALRY